MSFYLGKDNSGNSNYNILHLTEGYTTIDTIKSSTPVSATLFHSTLPYLQTKLVEVCPFYTNTYFNGQWNQYYWSTLLSNSAIDLINAGYQFTVLVKTRYSNGTWCSTGYGGIFAKVGPPYSFRADYTIPKFKCGPNNNPLSWDTSNELNYTNNYININRIFPAGSTIASNTGKVLSYDAYYDNRQDIIYECKIVIYDLVASTSSVSVQSLGVKISNNEFLINTPSGQLDMKNFYPLQSSDVSSATAFRSVNLGDTYITPYIPDANRVTGWIIDSDGTEPKICKILDGVTQVKVSSNIAGKLYFSRKVEYQYSITAQNSTVNSPIITTLLNNELAFAEISISFYSKYAGTRTMKGAAHFIDNTTSHVVANGRTAWQTNGVEHGSYFSLEVYAESNNIMLKNITRPAGSSGEAGTFSGTIRLFILKIN